jgi:hypothetical protein
VIRHLLNKKIKGWEKITEAWGLSRYGNKTSQIKQTKRFLEQITIPVDVTDEDEVIYTKPVKKNGKYVFSDQDILCTLKLDYVFGRKEIAEYMNKSVVQLSRYLKKYPSLKKIMYNSTGEFIYTNKYNLDNWLCRQKYKRLKSSGRLELYYKERARCLRRRNKYTDRNEFTNQLERIEIKYWGQSFPRAGPEIEDDSVNVCPVCGERLK